jgi:hypothetical protein
MKKLVGISVLLLAMALPAVSQAIRLSVSDQKRFDSYYSRWQQYRATNNASEVVSMEKRMQDVYSHYGIPANTPYGRVASSGGGWTGGGGSTAGTYRNPNWSQNHPSYNDPNWRRDHDAEWQRERERRREHDAAWHREHDHDWDKHNDRGLHRGWDKHDHDHDDHDRDHHDHDRDHHDHDHDHDRDHRR